MLLKSKQKNTSATSACERRQRSHAQLLADHNHVRTRDTTLPGVGRAWVVQCVCVQAVCPSFEVRSASCSVRIRLSGFLWAQNRSTLINDHSFRRKFQLYIYLLRKCEFLRFEFSCFCVCYRLVFLEPVLRLFQTRAYFDPKCPLGWAFKLFLDSTSRYVPRVSRAYVDP